MTQPKLFLAQPTGGKPDSRSHTSQEVIVHGQTLSFAKGGHRHCKDPQRYLQRHTNLKEVARFTKEDPR